MSCMTLIALPTMMTTPLARTACHETSEVLPISFAAEGKQPLSMSWVVVTDENGSRHLRMSWRTDLDV